METVQTLPELVISAMASACNFDSSELSLETSLADIGIDSLNMTSVLARIELVFGCTLDEEQVIEFLQADRIRDIVQMIDDLVRKPATA